MSFIYSDYSFNQVCGFLKNIFVGKYCHTDSFRVLVKGCGKEINQLN